MESGLDGALADLTGGVHMQLPSPRQVLHINPGSGRPTDATVLPGSNHLEDHVTSETSPSSGVGAIIS